MSYTEYYDEFRACQKNKAGFIMIGADIVNSKKVGKTTERVKLAKGFIEFVRSLGDDAVEMRRAASYKDEKVKAIILGDFFAFSIRADEYVKVFEDKFTEFLNQFDFEFHRGKAYFDVACQTVDNIMDFPWYYCAPFLEDMMKLKEMI